MTLLDRAPSNTFPSDRNFMTPRVEGYARVTFMGQPAWIELSNGEGFRGEPIWGVTFRRPDGGELWREEGVTDPSKCCHSRAEAIEYIETFAD